MTNKHADILRGLVATDCERLGVPGSADAAREAADEIERLDKKCAALEFLRDNPQVRTSIPDEPTGEHPTTNPATAYRCNHPADARGLTGCLLCGASF